MSAKSNYQYEKPFLHLLRKISGDPELQLTEAPLLQAEEIVIDEAHKQQLQAEIDEAQNCDFPDED